MTVKMSYRSDMNLRLNLGIGPRIGRYGGSSPRVRQDFAEDIEKIAKNTLGDRQRRTVRLVARNIGGLVFTQRRSIVDVDVPQGGRLGSGRKPVGAEPL
ncbi:hypothetical protein B296_00038929 [Ensete ventricosum]|uniref:Uncharacterized protein n=1 Tax=Ensete ventricosum TaxID=4639 RepID=A0A426WXA1_ENSVE|nr:hypothetical protein B296_00038929 [Ensete ventricosum]